ncbi:MAG: transcriptional regulator PpsR [Pseudomonadota bacterium]
MRDLDSKAAARLLCLAADIALVLDEDGVVEEVTLGGTGSTSTDWPKLLGKPWIDTVTVESRGKVEALLRAADGKTLPRWRQVNHATGNGDDLPVAYSSIQLGTSGRQFVVGRDLSTVAKLQQELVGIQQSMERDYARFRQAEARYRLLFQIASEAIVVVDAVSNRIIETNPAAGRMLGVPPARLVDRIFPTGLTDESAGEAREYLSAIKASGEAPEVLVTTRQGGTVRLAATLMRQSGESLLLVHLLPVQEAEATADSGHRRVFDVVDHSPDGFVITDTAGRVISANSAFIEMCQLGTTKQAVGRPLGDWLGREGVDLPVLLRNLSAEGGAIRLYRTILRGELETQLDVELSAVAALDSDEPCFGFTIRNVAGQRETEADDLLPVPQSVRQLTELVGQVPLKELVRETTHVIEKLCIEAALELTGNNRASAAAMLGLSRQSLYVKLRRYGLIDVDFDED